MHIFSTGKYAIEVYKIVVVIIIILNSEQYKEYLGFTMVSNFVYELYLPPKLIRYIFRLF